MKKLAVIIFVAVAFFSLTQMAVADTITIPAGYGPYQTGQGGEFTAIATGSLTSFIDYYSPLTSNLLTGSSNFQTFCMEYYEHINSNTTYTATLGNSAFWGGVGEQGDPLSIGTAYLYSQFATGQLSGYDYTNPGRSGVVGSSADLLQRAIWFLEDEYGGVNNSFVSMVATKFNTLDKAKADNNGTYAVKVLNLTLGNDRAQDQLIYVPEPTTILLLGLALVGLAGLKRKKLF